MNTATKMKTIAVHKRPPRRSRGDIIRSCNVGFVGKYKTKTAAIGRDLADAGPERRQYAKNWAKVMKVCVKKKCKHYDPKNKKVGGHCTLPKSEECIKQ